MPHASDDAITLVLPRFAVKALELHAKGQAKALLVLADSPVKGMKRKSEARRAEAAEWREVAAGCFGAMAAMPVPSVEIGEDDIDLPGFTDARPGTKA